MRKAILSIVWLQWLYCVSTVVPASLAWSAVWIHSFGPNTMTAVVMSLVQHPFSAMGTFLVFLINKTLENWVSQVCGALLGFLIAMYFYRNESMDFIRAMKTSLVLIIGVGVIMLISFSYMSMRDFPTEVMYSFELAIGSIIAGLLIAGTVKATDL